ncbi:hypothetical protein [Lichenibacterium minor]|jgi:hypothetical protein|uniref:hypothetical protein n=1 Tax=Lichenibacterium minor TaxID=2316528 RepID=UPI0013EBFD40|nr:hypothetical protein [Lichenibacterium minor]
MNSLKKTLALACAASVLSFGVAVAQTPPAAPDAGAAAAPAAGDTAAPAADTTMKKPMKKKMASKKMSHKKMMKKKAM